MNGTTNRAKDTGHLGRVGAATAVALACLALSASAQTAKDVKGATPLVAVPNEASVKLIVDPPIPEQLAQGRVFIQYRTENLRILPVFGNAATSVSPRVGHLHYYVDGQSWPTVDSSGETVVLVGLQPGPHKVRLELADATHKPIREPARSWSSRFRRDSWAHSDSGEHHDRSRNAASEDARGDGPR